MKLRVIAVKTLSQVLNSSLSLDEALFAELTRNSAETKPEFDRSWIYEICSGVLRYKGRLDYIMDTYALKKKPTGPLRRYLYTAIYQLLAQDTPSALVVSETVQAIRENEGDMPSKFANAILRKVADSREQWQQWSVDSKSPAPEQAAWSSLPEWLFKKLVKQRGLEFTLAFAKASLDRPVTWFRNLENGKAEILENGYQGNEARGFVQDISNQKMVDLVHKLLQERKVTGEILDLCSAPGGKAMALAEMGYQVVATDKDPNRLQKVTENKNRLAFTDEQLKVADFKSTWESGKRWNVIWLDVPCMSIGIIRRHPEIKWNRTEKDLPLLIQKQKELVTWARNHIAPGGLLIYSTCSLLNEENPQVLPDYEVIHHDEAFPQDEPFGDGIIATVFVASAEG